MPLAIFGAGHYDQVRAALDTSLDENQLPNATIGLPIFALAAETELLTRDPQAGSRTGVLGEQISRALVYLTAARIAPALPGLETVQVGDFRYTRSDWDAEMRAAELRGLAEAALATVLESSGHPAPLGQFWNAAGTRGR